MVSNLIRTPLSVRLRTDFDLCKYTAGGVIFRPLQINDLRPGTRF